MSDNNKNIDDIIKGGFNDANDDFNLDSWDDLAERLNENDGIDKSISEAFSGSEEEVPSAVWSNINDDLDVNTVWNRINEALTKRKRRAFIWWNAASIAFLLVFLTHFFTEQIPNNIVSKYEVEPLTLSHQKVKESELIGETYSKLNTNKVDNKNVILVPSSNSKVYDNYDNSLEGNEVKFEANINSTEQLFPHYGKDNSLLQPISMLEPLLPKFNALPLDTQLIAASSMMDTNNIQNEVVNIQPKMKPERKWIVGLKASLINSTIFDGLSSEANSENSLISNNFTVSLNPALFAQYNLRNGFFLQSDVYLNYRLKRSVNKYDQLEYVSRTTELDYFMLNLKAGKSYVLSKSSERVRLNIALGGYWDYLKSQREYRDQTLISEQRSYKKNNFGLESEIAIQHDYNRFAFSYGAQFELGINNINISSNKQIGAINSARTFSSGLFLRIGYKL